jgi:TonB family protein
MLKGRRNVGLVALLFMLVMAGIVAAGVVAGMDDQELKVTKKPRPSAKGCEGAGTGGSAIVKVTFQSDRTIGDVVIVEASTCAAFNDSVLRIAKEIEFEPAVKDGQPVTVTKQLQYAWAIY